MFGITDFTLPSALKSLGSIVIVILSASIVLPFVSIFERPTKTASFNLPVVLSANTFTFGPMLVKDGKVYKQVLGSPRRGYNSSAAKLTTVGQIDSNNFVIITTRNTAKLSEIAKLNFKNTEKRE